MAFFGESRRNKGCWVPAQTYLDNASSYLRHARTRGAEHAEYIGVTVTFRVVLDLVPGSAKIVHPGFVTPVAVKIVRDDCMTRPGFRLRGDVHRLRRVQPQVRRRHGIAKFGLIHRVRFLDQR